MRQLRSNASSEDRINQGTELAVGLAQFPETAPLAAPLQQQTAELDKRRQAREQKQRELLPLRVQLKFADYLFDQAVRGFSRSLEIADGGSRGALHRAIFPDGIGPIVAPAGESQLKGAASFVERVKAASMPGLDKVRSEWGPRLDEALAKLAAAVKARTAANEAVGLARIAEEAARDDHARAVDKLMGEVRALYPRDRKRWDVIFPVVRRSGSSDDADDNGDGGGGGGGEGGAAGEG